MYVTACAGGWRNLGARHVHQDGGIKNSAMC
ncbi:hypothetical protein A2U01_0016100, partial [Trifolium medium]|nr:hypothetical protein [Trifolium medium]